MTSILKEINEYFFGQSRFRLKLTVFLMAVALVPLLLLGVVSIYAININRRFEVAALETQLTNQKIKQIESFLNDIIEALRFKVASQEPRISLGEQNFLLSNLMNAFPSLEEVSFVAVLPENNYGKETFRISRDKLFSCGVIKDAEGEKLENCLSWSPDNLDDPQSLRNFQLAKEFLAAKVGKDYIGPMIKTSVGPRFIAAVPFKNEKDEIIGVIAAKIFLNPVVRLVEQSTLGLKGYVFVTDKDGSVIASSAPLFKALGYQLKKIDIVSSVLFGAKRTGLDSADAYANIFGDKVIGAGDIVKKTGWAVIAEWPEDDAFAPSLRLRNQIIYFSGALAAVIFLAATFAANRVVRPIKELVEGTKIIGEGKFDYKIDIKTKDELKDLGDSFNEMSKSLKKLAELREEFIFVAAHELRTPVTAIKGYLSMILEGTVGKISKKTAEFLKKIQASNDRLVQLVQDLLQVARSEAGRLKIALSPQKINESVFQVFDELRPLADDRNIIFEYSRPAKELVMADNDRLKEVLINLIGNAIKYNKNDGKIIVSHKVENNFLVTAIADTGIGFKPEEMPRLFEKFWRAENEATRAQTGTGLGLFIVKELVEKMGGKIWVESKWQIGATFYFSLPIAK
ncbi:MAG: sensor histidine kinase [Parcubacteria group bacterium]|nr:sensor histidine kinase [Parcubacteria group bacterium]